MKVLGIDPGTVLMGWGLVADQAPDELQPGSDLWRVDSGVLKAPSGLKLEKRLALLYGDLVSLIELRAPDIVVIEKAYVGRYPSAAMALGHARGMAMAAAWRCQVDVDGYEAKVLKRSVTGNGAASKDLVSTMVMGLLLMESSQGYDETDALAVAICHLNHVQERALIAGAAE